MLTSDKKHQKILENAEQKADESSSERLESKLTPRAKKLLEILTEMHELSREVITLSRVSANKDEEEQAVISAYDQNQSLAPSAKSHGLSMQQHALAFFLSATSAIVFGFSAANAIARYPFGNIDFFKYNAIVSAVETNWFFNWMAYIDLLEYDETVSPLHQAFAIFAAICVIAPYFIIGFVGALWQKIVVTFSTLANIPVFYLGALDFYDYFHASFMQQFRWTIRSFQDIAKENFRLATQKSAEVYSSRQRYKAFSFGSKEERTQWMQLFANESSNDQLELLIDNKGRARSTRSWLRWIFCSGTGPLIGTAVMAQNPPHVVVTGAGIIAIKGLAIEAGWTLASIMGLGNLVPSIGFSSATMENFDAIDFLRACFFIDVPQIQRVVERSSWSATISLRVGLTIGRYLYLTSGFSNDEVGYEGAQILGADEQAASISGYNANVAGAVVFNGVLNEKLLRTVLGWMATSFGKADAEDLCQLKFEQLFKKLLDTIAILSTIDIRSMRDSKDLRLTGFVNRFFPKESSSQKAPETLNPMQQN